MIELINIEFLSATGFAQDRLQSLLRSFRSTEPGCAETSSPGLCQVEQGGGLLPGIQHAGCPHPTGHGQKRGGFRQGKEIEVSTGKYLLHVV